VFVVTNLDTGFWSSLQTKLVVMLLPWIWNSKKRISQTPSTPSQVPIIFSHKKTCLPLDVSGFWNQHHCCISLVFTASAFQFLQFCILLASTFYITVIFLCLAKIPVWIIPHCLFSYMDFSFFLNVPFCPFPYTSALRCKLMFHYFVLVFFFHRRVCRHAQPIEKELHRPPFA
jgi:hypothetical protein